jgi:Zn-dependent protease
MDRSRELEGKSAPEPRTAPDAPMLPLEPPPPRRGLLARLLAPVILAGGLLLKFGVGSLKFLAVFVSVGGYALIWGWSFAVGFVALILVHELGHYIEAKRLGFNPSLPVFIPFLGAYVALKNAPFDPWRNARVTLAGPVLGGMGALAVLGTGVAIDSRLLQALAYTGFFLNLVNLIPIGILDGGRLLHSWRVLRAGGGADSYQHARAMSWQLAVLTIGTAVALAVGMFAAHVPQDRL